MISKLILMLFFSCSLLTSSAQVFQSVSLTIGDAAPPLRVKEWLKGSPITAFEAGKIYVLDFWATWCGPCIKGMPALSALAHKYRNRVEILGIDIKERRTTTLQQVQAFIDSMGHRMDFAVAQDDSASMATAWYEASGDPGIPRCFVVDKSGHIAWIGHTAELAPVLLQIVNNTWDIKQALAQRNHHMRLKQLDYAANSRLSPYEGNEVNFVGDPDSALLVINELVTREPELKFAPLVANYTFSALLKTNFSQAYAYGKQAMQVTTYTDPPYNEIISVIDNTAGRFAAPPAIYQLGAEAYQALLNRYPEHMSIPKTYMKMAEWYMRANDKSKARQSLRKASKLIKKSKGKYWSGYL